MSNDHFALTALSPLDGRYRSHLTEVATLFSEFSLIKHRLEVEVAYVLFLSQEGMIPKITKKHQTQLQTVVIDFDLTEAAKVKALERQTKHDVKAIEYYLRDCLRSLHSPLTAFIHLALTSEDTNSLSYSLLLKAAQVRIVVPHLKQLVQQLGVMANDYAAVPMLARTHGQSAVPTTVGKELLNFAMRLLSELQLVEALPIEAKLNGAVGNFNAHVVAFSGGTHDWLKLSSKFVKSLGLQPQLFTTQILPPESYTRFFSSLVRINGILLDLNQDLWRYISDGYLIQKLETGQVGSSTMPHKVNPIDFENSEGNLGLATALLSHFITKLPISRLQRDLSDSTVKRSLGTALGYEVLAFQSLTKGLKKLSVNQEKITQDLDQHWEILAEAIQVVLRLQGDDRGYEKLQQLSQGKVLTETTLHDFIDTLDLPKTLKKQLHSLRPTTYVGEAQRLTQLGVLNITQYLQGVV